MTTLLSFPPEKDYGQRELKVKNRELPSLGSPETGFAGFSETLREQWQNIKSRMGLSLWPSG